MSSWQRWHDGYRDPSSDLSSRLRVVQDALAGEVARRPPGRLRLLSMCAGQGDDVVGALAGSPRAQDVDGVLVELDEENVRRARAALSASGISGLACVHGDAGTTTAYAGAVPADLLVVCGVFGNIPDDHVRRTVLALPRLASPGAFVVWTRHRRGPDLTPAVRAWFAEAGFVELSFTSPGPGRFAVGTARLATTPLPYASDLPLFTFEER